MSGTYVNNFTRKINSTKLTKTLKHDYGVHKLLTKLKHTFRHWVWSVS